MLDGVSVLLVLPLERPSLLGVLETLRPAELLGIILICGRPRFAPGGLSAISGGFSSSLSRSDSSLSLFC